MSHRARWLLGLVAALTLGCLQAPVLWSPDGRWVAYTTVVRSETCLLKPGWLFETGSGAGIEREATDPAKRPAAKAYRIWATRPETGDSVLLEESRGPLTSPAWSPDGKGLAFGRLVAEEGRSRFEVVVQDSPDRKRVVLKQPYGEFPARASELPGLSLAWSPDARYLAIPLFQQTLGLAIIRADTGRVLKVVEDAFLPSWSRDGTKLAFVRGTDAESLHYLDTNFGPPRHLVDIGRTTQAPVWSHDGQSILVIAQRRGRPGADPPAPRCDLVRIPIDGGRSEWIPLSVDQPDRDKSYRGASFSFDPEGENLFYTVDADGQPSVVTWYRPRNKEIYKRFNPIDFSIRVGSLACSPNGKNLAFRAGAAGDFPPPGLWDLYGNRFSPLVPDEVTRVDWVTTLVIGARQLLRDHLPRVVSESGRQVERPTLLPVPGEFPANHELMSRLRQIGRLGRRLCEPPADSLSTDPSVIAFLDEARLFFDYLCENYTSALSALDALESRTMSPERRLRLLSLRAQIFLGQGEDERAGQTIAYLQSIERTAPRRFEDTPAGPSLTEDATPGQGWPRFLAHRAKQRRDALAQSTAGQPNLHDGDPFEPPDAAGPFAPPNFVEFREEPVKNLPGGDAVGRMPGRIVPIQPRPQRFAPPQRLGPAPRRFVPPAPGPQ